MLPLVLAGLLAAHGGAPAAPARVRVAAFSFPKDLLPAESAAALREVVRGLELDVRLEPRDPEELLLAVSGDLPEGDIRRARAQLDQGLRLLAERRGDAALPKLRATAGEFARLLAYVRKTELEDAQAGVAVAHALEGRHAQAVAAFVDLLVWRPGHELAAGADAAAARAFEEARAQVAARPRGSVEIASEPAGAEAFVDGRSIGPTPATADGLAVGTHYVTLRLEGYVKQARRVEVSDRLQQNVAVSLREIDRWVLVRRALDRARDHLGEEQADDSMTQLRTVLGIDQAVFVKVERDGGDVEAEAFLYDLRSQRLLARADKDADRADPKALAELAPALYERAPLDGAAMPDDVAAAPGPPVWRRWWFWTAVGVAAAAVAVPLAIRYAGDDGGASDSRGVTIRF